RCYRRRELVRRRWKSAWLANRRADAWRAAERTDAHERPVVLAICGLGRGRHPGGLCGLIGSSPCRIEVCLVRRRDVASLTVWDRLRHREGHAARASAGAAAPLARP